MNKDKYLSDLLKRYRHGNVTKQERAALEQWVDNLPEADFYAELPEDERMAMAQTALERINHSIHKQNRQKRIRLVVFRAAAAIALLVVASVAIWQWQAIDVIEVQTQANNEKVILPDGSIIWLRENSSVTFPERFTGNTRTITFNGNALFEVAKDKAHPFVIQAGTMKATVLGTSFNLRSKSNALELTVLTGKVALSNSNGTGEVVVLPNEKITYTGKKEAAKEVAEVIEVQQIITGTEYNMDFANTAVHEIISRIEGKFNVIIDTDHITDSCVVTSNLSDKSLEETLHLLATLLDFKYEQKDNAIVIREGGCR